MEINMVSISMKTSGRKMKMIGFFSVGMSLSLRDLKNSLSSMFGYDQSINSGREFDRSSRFIRTMASEICSLKMHQIREKVAELRQDGYQEFFWKYKMQILITISCILAIYFIFLLLAYIIEIILTVLLLIIVSKVVSSMQDFIKKQPLQESN